MLTEVLKIWVKNMEKDKNTLEKRENLRKLHKILQNKMPEQEIYAKSERICRNILNSDWYQCCDVIYGYYPLAKEADCRPVLRQALADGKTVALPRTEADCQMDFYRITSLDEVKEGRFHVMEPVASCEQLRETNAAVLVPGVVFDRQGNRYGYGKGYYDRYFAEFPRLYRVALAYEIQMEDEIPVLPTDVPMHLIYTELTIYQTLGG